MGFRIISIPLRGEYLRQGNYRIFKKRVANVLRWEEGLLSG